MDCEHQPRSVQGVLQQTKDGHWTAVFATPEGRDLRAVRFCPFCGVELHGRPHRDEPPPLQAQAHSQFRRREA